jgi:hypothetical protein
MKKILFPILLCFLISSCKFDFEETDLTFYNNYRVNQLLIFKSDRDEIDTFIITSKNKFYNDWAPLERDGKYNPPNAVVKYEKLHSNEFKTLNLNVNDYEDANLLYFRKSNPENKSASIMFSFQNILEEFPSNMAEVEKEKIVFKEKYVECYFFKKDTDNMKPNEIKKIYLDSNLQILKYELKSGEIWYQTKLKTQHNTC